MLGGSKVSISLVCVSISIFGEINQAMLDNTLAPVGTSIRSWIHSPVSRRFAL
jgi:hypothetical protein